MSDTAWNDTTEYLRLLGAGRYQTATDLLVAAIDREGEGAIVDALTDCCRALMQRITYGAGVVDVRAVVTDLAERVANAAVDTRGNAVDDMQTLIVFLGSEGLPALGELGLEKVADAPAFARTAVKEVGADLWESYVRKA